MANFLVDHEYTIDIIPSARPQLVHVSEYDVGRRFTFTITQGGEEFIGLTSSVGDVTVEGTIGSYAFSEPASIENGKIVFQLTESMTAHAGKAWTKIKFANADAPISTCAFFLVVDRAGVEADTVIGADGFEQQIVNAVNDWLDEHPPASGGMTEEFKQTLLACFRNVAWAVSDGQSFYDALYNALYQQANLSYITAVFVQGDAVIYTDDSLDTLKQYLTVIAHYDDETSVVLEDSDYTLSGTLVVGTSTIRVIYSGKTTTFTCTVTQQILPTGYTRIEYINVVNSGSAPVYVATGVIPTANLSATYKFSINSLNSAGHFASGSFYYLPFFRSGKLFANRNSTEYDQTFNGLRVDTPYTIDAYMSSDRIDVNSENVTTLSAGSRSSSAITLFTYNGQTSSSFLFSGRLYFMKLYNSGTLIHDYIPCKNNNDVVGLWDAVDEVFLTSATANPLYEP